MITLRYSPVSGVAVPDGKVIDCVHDYIRIQKMYATQNFTFEFSTENVFQRVQLAILDGILNYLGIQYAFGPSVWLLNKYGEPVSGWADGFCDHSTLINELILKAMMRMDQ